MLDDVIRLQFNTVETIWRQQQRGHRRRYARRSWKNPAKVYWKERFILRLVRERERTGERAILLNVKTLMTTMWFISNSSFLSPGLNFTFFRVANRSWYSSRRPTIAVLSESGPSAHTGRPQWKSLDRSPVPCYAVWPNRWRIGFWRPWTAVQKISSYCQSLRNKKKLNPENG